jgi:SAM-dependent methyltransferase
MIKWLIKKIILFSQRVPLFRARGSYSFSKTFRPKSDLADPYLYVENEFDDYQVLVDYLKPFNLMDNLRRKTVLDFGSGHGGRSFWFAQYAGFVEGIEIHQSLVDISTEYAGRKNIQNIHYSVGSETKIAFADQYFDVIISFDVLEHVQKPDLIMAEFQRVLKKGGIAIVIFTPYYGMFSHHLNYVTLFPALHWLFSPHDLVEAVNELLIEYPPFAALHIDQQPGPGVSYNGKRLCLPTLNGLTAREYKGIVASLNFEIITLKFTPILSKFPILGTFGKMMNRILNYIPGFEEYFSHNVVSILRKP